MRKKLKVTIVLDVKDNRIALDQEDAKELYQKLHEMFGERKAELRMNCLGDIVQEPVPIQRENPLLTKEAEDSYLKDSGIERC